MKNRQGFTRFDLALFIALAALLVLIMSVSLVPAVKIPPATKEKSDLSRAKNRIIAYSKNRRQMLMPDAEGYLPGIKDRRNQPYFYYTGYDSPEVCGRHNAPLLKVQQCGDPNCYTTTLRVYPDVAFALIPQTEDPQVGISVEDNITVITVAYPPTLGGRLNVAGQTVILDGVSDNRIYFLTHDNLLTLMGCPLPEIIPANLPLIPSGGGEVKLANTVSRPVYWCVAAQGSLAPHITLSGGMPVTVFPEECFQNFDPEHSSRNEEITLTFAPEIPRGVYSLTVVISTSPDTGVVTDIRPYVVVID